MKLEPSGENQRYKRWCVRNKLRVIPNVYPTILGGLVESLGKLTYAKTLICKATDWDNAGRGSFLIYHPAAGRQSKAGRTS